MEVEDPGESSSISLWRICGCCSSSSPTLLLLLLLLLPDELPPSSSSLSRRYSRLDAGADAGTGNSPSVWRSIVWYRFFRWTFALLLLVGCGATMGIESRLSSRSRKKTPFPLSTSILPYLLPLSGSRSSPGTVVRVGVCPVTYTSRYRACWLAVLGT